ncbi:MAG TPA: type II secretion system protein GspM [Rhizomicrobium sp.]|jgi:general secretion pathway protein M
MSLRSLLLAIGTAVLLLVALPAWFLFSQQSDETVTAKRQLAVYEAEIAERAHLSEEAAALKQSDAAAAFVPGVNAELAAANLQSKVKMVVESLGGQIHSAQNMPSTITGHLEKIAVHYELSVPPGRLTDTLYRLETSQPFLFLDDIDVIMPESWLTEGSPEEPPNLNLRMTVGAYRWAGAQ